MMSSHLLPLLAVVASGFVPAPQESSLLRRTSLFASSSDVEALASRLDSADAVESLFIFDGEPRRFLRRQQFYDRIAALPGDGKISDEGLLDFWIYFGGAPPREVDQKKTTENKGFFGAFADTLKQNAMGKVDDRPKNNWGDTVQEMTIIDAKTMLESDLGIAGFSPDAFKEALLTES